MNTLLQLLFMPAFLVFAVTLSGCSGDPQFKHTPSILKQFEKDQGIKIDLPDTWNAQSRSYIPISGTQKALVCEINLESPYPSRRSSRTYLSVCVPTDERLVFDVETLVKGVWADYKYNSNPTKTKYGSINPFYLKDGFKREWEGFQFVSEKRGINSISGGPFIKNIINVVIPLSGNGIIWLTYSEPVSFDIELGDPYSHGLSVFDSITIMK